MPTVNLITLGCSKNLVDSEVVMEQLRLNGWTFSDDSDGSDVAVINTCGFIEAAKEESIDTIVQAVRLKKEGRIGRIVVMGCLSERYAAELRKEIPEVDAYIGANKMADVVTALGGDVRRELLGERMLTTPRHYAFLKISEGCDRPCSFCSIPLMRGRHASKPMDRVVTEARRLAALGVRELILIAQDSTWYGLDLYGERVLAQLLRRLGEVEGIAWIRIMYAFPAGFPAGLAEEIAANPRVCNYLDIPIQHVADPILASMKRGISGGRLRELIRGLRAKIPGVALRTTLIAGYPGEGEREFGELLSFVEEGMFDRLGVFTYSQEEGTSAYDLGDPVPREVKEERRNLLMEAQRKVSLARNRKAIGTTMRVIVDEPGPTAAVGRSEHDAPEVDNAVTIHEGGALRAGDFADVTIVDAEEYDLFALPAAAGRRSASS